MDVVRDAADAVVRGAAETRGMRIIAGRFKGVPLTTPRSVTRPTTDRTKEAIFSRLDSWGVLRGARVLDLYAGTGALGFESLSRGARELVLVEADAQAARLIARTATLLCHQRDWTSDMSVRVVKARAERYAQKMAARNDLAPVRFDVVLMDPPYAVTTDECNELLATLASGGVVSADGLMMLERSVRSDEPVAPSGWHVEDRRDYGETAVFYFSAD